MWWHVVNYTPCTLIVIRTGRTLRDIISTFSPRIFPPPPPTRSLSSSFEIRINPPGGVNLCRQHWIEYSAVTYELPFSPKIDRTVCVRSVLQKRLPRRDPPDFPRRGSREIIYSPSLCCDSYVPTANSKLLISWNYGVGNVLFRLGSFVVADALSLRSRNVQMGFLGHYLSTRLSV